MRIPRALALLTPVLAAALTSVLLATPSTALAQGGITVTRTSVERGSTTVLDSSQLGSSSLRGYNVVDCAAASTTTTNFTLTNYPTGTQLVDVWLGDATTDCALVTSRATGTGRSCTHLTVNPTVGATGQFSMTLAQMFDPNTAADPVKSGCSSTSETANTYKLWFFATTSEENTGEVPVAQYGSVTFLMDVGVPSAPTPTATTLSGGGAVSVVWESTSTNTTNESYRVFIDDSVSDCSGTSTLMPGGVAPTDADYDANGSSESVELDDYAEGRSVLVFVSAVDASENESVLSSAVCVTRVATVGFCEALAASGQPCTNSCVAGARGDRPLHEWWWIAAAAIAVAFRRRARR